MTKEEFVKGYADRSGLSVEALAAMGYYCEPCDCDYPGCNGWQMSRDQSVPLTGGSK